MNKSPAGIVDTPINIIRKKLWAGVPILGGYKQNDGSVFTPLFQSKPSDKRIDSDSLLSAMNRFYPYSSDSAKGVADYLNKQQDRMLSLRDSEPKNETSSEDDFYMVLRDHMFKCQFQDFLLLASAEAPVYHYISESNSNANIMKQIFGQTEAHAHSWGHPFFPSRIRSRTTHEIPSNIQKYWANFAAHSSPESDDLEPWPQFNQSELIMSISESTRTKQSPHTSECDFFNVVEIISTTKKARIVTEEEGEKSPFWSGFLFSILLFLLCILSCRIVAGTALK